MKREEPGKVVRLDLGRLLSVGLAQADGRWTRRGGIDRRGDLSLVDLCCDRVYQGNLCAGFASRYHSIA